MEIVSGEKQLSHQALALWAKTGGKENPQMWEPLAVHMADSGEVARLLWHEWMANSVKCYISNQFDSDEPRVEALLVFLASIHDIGKATPSFQSHVPGLAERVQITGLRFERQTDLRSHAYMGEAILKRWLLDLGCDKSVALGPASIVGGHHGTHPTEANIDVIEHSTRISPLASMGDEPWIRVQNELLRWAYDNCNLREVAPRASDWRIPAYAQILMLGIVIMADWIASNTELCPLEDEYRGWEASRGRAIRAWKRLGLLPPIALNAEQASVDELFADRFVHLANDAKPYALQKDATHLVRNIGEPQLVIIEAGMGSGKTEAALMCAELLAQRFDTSGVAFLLPTQATSNAMFLRVESWLRELLGHQRVKQVQDIHLLHGKAALNEDYAALPAWGTSWMGDTRSNEEAIVAHQWFSGSKRGLLAPFVVGTVDQLLMAALRAKHVHLRHLGLAGKVVIIDEVHAYDAYMSLYLDRVLSFLGAYRVPVILLSATLPPTRRVDLLNAYRGNVRRHFRHAQVPDAVPKLPSGDPAYPLISHVAGSRRARPEYEVVEASIFPRCVELEYLDEGDDLLVEMLSSTLRDGGCVCVLRNTVRRAQQTYRLLSEHFGDDVVLVHARFLATDRVLRETRLARELGRNNDKRPTRLVLVGTQVLEQSLDIDLDFLITDIAPVDLLLQRIGRLHRHVRGEGQCLRPPALRRARCVITGVESWDAPIPEFAKGIVRVYERANLLRTIAALEQRMAHNHTLELPRDIAPLVSNVYECEVRIPQRWERVYENALNHEQSTRARKEESAAQWLLPKPRRHSLDGWMQGVVNISDENKGRAAVRDIDEGIEVVVVQGDSRGYQILPWVAERYNIDASLGNGMEMLNEEAARIAALCTLCLPPELSTPNIMQDVLDALYRMSPCRSWDESKWLRGQIPLALNERGEVTIAWPDHQYRLKYSAELGIEVL